MIFLTFFQPFLTVGTLFAFTFGRNEKCSVLFYQKKGMIFNGPSGSSEVRMGFL